MWGGVCFYVIFYMLKRFFALRSPENSNIITTFAAQNGI